MKKKIALVLLLIFIVYIVASVFTFLSVKKALGTTNKAVAAIKNQDLDGAKNNLIQAKKDFEGTKKTLIIFTPLRVIPLLGWYVADVQRGIDAAVYGLDGASVFAEAITPYADVLGLKGKGTFLGGTAQERLAKIVEAISKAAPQLDTVDKDLSLARTQVDKIATWRYPNFLPGRPGTKIASAKEGLDQISTLLGDARPLLLVLPDIMGQNQEKKYLVLFQNNAELRPTGGFITAYAVFRVNKGVIASEGSDDIYRLDSTLLKKVPAPPAVLKYFPGVTTLNLRDSNLSPDYRSSMELFESLYQSSSGKKDIDGIISLDTNFVLSLMRVLGPIDAYGTSFTTDKVDACGCAQVIYELERYADEPVAYEKGSRKDILGVLMQQMMAKSFAAPKSKWPDLLKVAMDSLREKHLLLYMHNSQSQEALEKINFAGRIYQYDGDYLHVSDANFAGAKSNLYVVPKVKQVVKKGKDGNISKTVTIDYKYPRQGDNCSLERKGGLCLAGIYRDYIRVYVPKGSTLTKSSGTEVAFSTTQDLDKTVFEGFFTLRPEGTAHLEIEYTVPIKLGNQYKLLIQKQPGTQDIMYELDAFGKRQKPFPLNNDKEIIIKL